MGTESLMVKEGVAKPVFNPVACVDYFCDFEHESDLEDWTVGGNWGLGRDGLKGVLEDAVREAAFVVTGEQFESFRLEAEVQTPDVGGAAWNVLFMVGRYQAVGPTRYTMVQQDGGNLQLHRFDPGQVLLGQVASGLLATDWHIFLHDYRGANLRAETEGWSVARVDATYPRGSVGFFNNLADHIRARWLSVRRIAP